MLYKLSLLALNTPLVRRAVRSFRKVAWWRPLVDNAALITRHAPGKSFADIGCMWGIEGANSFLAEASGATRTVAVDVYPESEAFLAQKQQRNSAVQFVSGDIHLRETVEKLGVLDVVLCSGVLYHTPDPFHLLRQLRTICGETLILSTQSIPEMHGIRNAAIFYPFLPEAQRRIWDRGVGNQKGIRGPYEPESGYGNWFWGMTPSAIESMLRCAGFEVQERHVAPFSCIFVCRTTPPRFVAESGAWVTTNP